MLLEVCGSLLLMYGYYDYMGLYWYVVDWVLGMGFLVFVCDLLGYGLFEGEWVSICDFVEY